MSVIDNPPPVTETMPPFIFMIMCSMTVQHAYSICLWKNGQWLTIQVPRPPDADHKFSGDREYIDSELKQLQPFAKSLVFGKTNWAYFTRSNDGKRAIAYRQRPPYHIKYPSFAPVVHQSEFIQLRPAQGDIVEGIWRGQQVDAQLAWDDATSELLERQMKAYDMLRGLDLTFEVVAHLVNSEGNMTGMMSEPAFGRPFQVTDMIALSDAMCRLFDRGLFWRLDPIFPNIMMSLDNKVRLLNYCPVRKFRDDKERESERAKLQHTLHQLYIKYKDDWNWNSSYRYRHALPQLIDATYSLEWPIVLVIHGPKERNFAVNDNPDMPLSARRLKYHERKNSSTLPLAPTTKLEEVNESDHDNDTVIVPRNKRVHQSNTSHPYHGPSRKSRKILLAPD